MSHTAIMPAAPAATAVPTVLVRPLDALASITLFGNVARPALTASDTHAAFSLLLYVAAPMSGPPPHKHRDQDETFITVDEGFEFLAGDTWQAVPPQTVVHIPAGTRHTFRNATDTPRRTWVLTRPGNQEQFFAALSAIEADAQRTGTAPDMSRVAEVYDAYGVEPMP